MIVWVRMEEGTYNAIICYLKGDRNLRGIKNLPRKATAYELKDTSIDSSIYWQGSLGCIKPGKESDGNPPRISLQSTYPYANFGGELQLSSLSPFCRTRVKEVPHMPENEIFSQALRGTCSFAGGKWGVLSNSSGSDRVNKSAITIRSSLRDVHFGLFH